MRPHLVLVVAALIAVTSRATIAQDPAESPSEFAMFDDHTDIGDVKHAGSTQFDETRQEFTLAAAGANMWGARDEFHFAWKRVTGDFQITAEVALLGEGVDPHRKLGVMFRDSLKPDSAYVDIALHGDGTTSLQFRRTAGAATEQVHAPLVGAEVVQLERKGNRFTMRIAWREQPFAATRTVDVDLANESYVGIFVCSHNADVVEKGTFRNVRLVKPAPDGFTPYRDYIGSRLELIEIDSGRREVLHTTDDSMQAPNWTADGKALIYNRNGRLYRFDLSTRLPTELDTGAATANNNDHVLSFDGTMLGISHHDPGDGGRSHIYTLPVEGGEPKRVTARGPSYFHGWSPDARELVFTGDRDGAIDIYQIPAAGGEEQRLTDAEGVDDGPEFTPDGRWIYFNSSRSGRMQIWRMTASGGDQQQVSDDEFNNWFPHISPDGKWIAMLSYLPDVTAGDHPFYKQVTLRVMPAGGGPARVVAYLYGGQGTMNVPSWSPDSKRLAFVSNTANLSAQTPQRE
jgi:TolB protein